MTFYRADGEAGQGLASAAEPAAPSSAGVGDVRQSSGFLGPMRITIADLIFLAGLAALVVPTMMFVGGETWSGEEGAHGPIVLMTGLWLLWRKWPDTRAFTATPAAWKVAVLALVLVPLYVLARVTQIIEIEGYLMYFAALTMLYAIVGGVVLRKLAFPLIYLAFMFPPPDTVVYAITMPMKIGISESAIALLRMFGYPIGGTGVTIQIGQYQLLVAAACSGLNSIVSLSALTTFYIYIRHANNLRYALVLLLCVVPVAIAANFVRVLILILLTYHAGEATAQSFLHDLAGLTMFALALLFMFLVDCVLARFFPKRDRDSSSPSQPTGALT